MDGWIEASEKNYIGLPRILIIWACALVLLLVLLRDDEISNMPSGSNMVSYIFSRITTEMNWIA